MLAIALYLAGIGLILGGCFLLWGWPVFLIVAGAIVILVGMIVAD